MKLLAKHTTSAEIKNEYSFTSFMACTEMDLSVVTFELTHGFSHSML